MNTKPPNHQIFNFQIFKISKTRACSRCCSTYFISHAHKNTRASRQTHTNIFTHAHKRSSSHTVTHARTHHTHSQTPMTRELPQIIETSPQTFHTHILSMVKAGVQNKLDRKHTQAHTHVPRIQNRVVHHHDHSIMFSSSR